MSVGSIRIRGYRSIEDLELELDRCRVVVGPNGVGKTNLYQGLRLMHAAAEGELSRHLLREGGAGSALWAGDRRPKKKPVRMVLQARFEDIEYGIELGLPSPPQPPAFQLDTEVKEEWIAVPQHGRKKPALLLERKGGTAWCRDADGVRVPFPFDLWSAESILSQVREPHRFPVASHVQQVLRGWRFYHGFRTDPDSPMRVSRAGIRTPVLSHDGADLAAALATIEDIGDAEALHTAIEDAFPGSALHVGYDRGNFWIEMQMPGVRRPFAGRELSDGTLRYLCLCAVLLSPRPSSFLVLNEPETSLHPDLIPSLAALVAKASRDAQILITTHSEPLARCLRELVGTAPVELVREEAATRVAGGIFEGRKG